MTDIDWSKAPEWATVFIKGTCSSSFYFEKTDRYERDGGFYRLKSDSDSFSVYPRPAPSWSGEGLPPVGVHVEWYSDVYGWLGGKVIGHDGAVAVVSHNDGYTGCHLHNLKPIRTPEQIAKDERDKAIDEIRRELMPVDEYVAELILDAITRLGYRKP